MPACPHMQRARTPAQSAAFTALAPGRGTREGGGAEVRAAATPQLQQPFPGRGGPRHTSTPATAGRTRPASRSPLRARSSAAGRPASHAPAATLKTAAAGSNITSSSPAADAVTVSSSPGAPQCRASYTYPPPAPAASVGRSTTGDADAAPAGAMARRRPSMRCGGADGVGGGGEAGDQASEAVSVC